MSEQGLVERIRGETDQIIELLRSLIERESPSHRKDLVDQVGAFIVDHLRANRFTPRVESRKEVGDIIWAEWGKGEKGRVLVLCHIDTVWEPGSLARNPFRVEDGRIYGPGIFDMKSGVAATLKVQEYLARGWICPGKKVRFLYTTDEEVASLHSRAIIEEFARRSDLVLVLEPPLPGGGLKTFRKGVGRYVVKIHGKSAHSGLEPEKGINAVEELARQILDIHALSAPEKGTNVTVNVARGGTAQNVIAEYAEAVVDLRFREIEEGERADCALRNLSPHVAGIRLEVEGGIDRPPMIKSRRSKELFKSAKHMAAELGIDLDEGESGGGSDGNITAALGVPTLDGLGIVGDGAHAWHEHVEVAELAPRIALLARLIERL
ncbi:M20 family metallopeptidase [Acidobacteria bacterium AH-259-A15]|nr:M20 family metallopeptidase [Acidobacteria bacterium AH-259-A15]